MLDLTEIEAKIEHFQVENVNELTIYFLYSLLY